MEVKQLYNFDESLEKIKSLCSDKWEMRVTDEYSTMYYFKRVGFKLKGDVTDAIIVLRDAGFDFVKGHNEYMFTNEKVYGSGFEILLSENRFGFYLNSYLDIKLYFKPLIESLEPLINDFEVRESFTSF